MSFIHLQLHTEYSLLEGFAKMDKLFSTLKRQNSNYVAITDFGSMFGAVTFFDKAIKNGINPILGCELYIRDSDYKHGNIHYDSSILKNVVLLVKDEVGYKNLIKLVSMSYKTQVNSKPTISKQQLFSMTAGLICLSGGNRSNIKNMILINEKNEVSIEILEYMKAFGRENYYIILNDFGEIEHKKTIIEILKLKEMLKFNVVATNDVHFINKEDYENYKTLIAIGKNISVSEVKTSCNEQAYLKSPNEMTELFKYIPEAISNTKKIAEKCVFRFEYGNFHLPHFPLDKNIDKEQYIRQKCMQGRDTRYPEEYFNGRLEKRKIIDERIDYELTVIKEMGYIDYFLIVWDFVNFAKTNGIRVGPCRGSGGGSIVAYCLKITDVDPVEYNLIFERFLNPQRVTMPDFDIDFQDDRRNEVVQYVFEKYSSSNVANIVTFGHFKPRLAIRDIGRVLGYEYPLVDKVAKMIPNRLNISIDEALKENAELYSQYISNSKIKTIIDRAKEIENLPRHASTHAAGIVITADALDEYIPLYINDDMVSTQFSMMLLERLGILKVDFLGLITLTIIENTSKSIRENISSDFDIDKISFDDKKTYELISTGRNLGVFQLESKGMREFMRELKPDNLEDIIAGISLYRPGPMESIPRYIRNKKNPKFIKYKDEKLKPILELTYGCIVYQEQVMEIVRSLGGYSYGRADEIRRAMSKKKTDVMDYERGIFINGLEDENSNVLVKGCKRNGINHVVANSIYDEMVDFAKYAFNKSHATGYAVLAYQTAYLKTHYPREFFAVILSSNTSNHKKMMGYIKECQRLGIEILPPSINYSYRNFKVEGGKIRFGLFSIKNIGSSIVEEIVKSRNKDGKFKDLEDLIKRIGYNNLNKKSIESLIKSGSCDKIIYNRNTALNNYEKMIEVVGSIEKVGSMGQITIFDEGQFDKFDKVEIKKYEELDIAELQDSERALLGDTVENIVKSSENIVKSSNRKLYIKLENFNREETIYLKKLFDKYLGESEVILYSNKERKSIKYSKGVKVNSLLLNTLKSKYGFENVIFM